MNCVTIKLFNIVESCLVNDSYFLLYNVIDIVLVFGSGIGVTAGAHRLWSHRSYKAKWPLRLILITLFTIAGQVRLLDGKVHSNLIMCFCREKLTDGFLIIEYITNVLKLMEIHTMQREVSSLHILVGYS